MKNTRCQFLIMAVKAAAATKRAAEAAADAVRMVMRQRQPRKECVTRKYNQ